MKLPITIFSITSPILLLAGSLMLFFPNSVRANEFVHNSLALLFFNKNPHKEPVELTNRQIYICGITNIVMGLVGIVFIIFLKGQ